MNNKELITEHEKLIKILRNPSKRKLMKEAKKQAKELKGYKKKK
jgi:hypothetical protein